MSNTNSSGNRTEPPPTTPSSASCLRKQTPTANPNWFLCESTRTDLKNPKQKSSVSPNPTITTSTPQHHNPLHHYIPTTPTHHKKPSSSQNHLTPTISPHHLQPPPPFHLHSNNHQNATVTTTNRAAWAPKQPPHP
ncbi:hypothetical protein QL285_091401 [Trifolium repens]|nr:hypothetical protein QL285_091401 [Trifolium repens]